MASATQNTVKRSYEDLFLPESLVKLVLKISKKFDISNHDVFSILDTLQFALFNEYCNSLRNETFKDEQKMCILIINIIRVSEKYHKAASSFSKNVDKIFKEMGINKNVYNVSEFEAFKLMKFEQVKSPAILEEIYKLVKRNIESNKMKNLVYDNSNNVLVIFYCWKNRIYQELQKTIGKETASKFIKDKRLVAASVIIATLKILNISEYIQTFDKICEKNEIPANEVNELAALIFGLVKVVK